MTQICCHYPESNIVVLLHTASHLAVVAQPRNRWEIGSHSDGSALRDAQFDDKEGKKRTEEEVSDLQKIAGPNLCRMIAQKRLPVLSSRCCAANLAHVFLNGPFTHPNIQLEKFPTDALGYSELPRVGCVLPSA